MRCPNCHFENLPGLDGCGRCGASLNIATAVIDVHPPRARDRRFRRLSSGWSWWLRGRNAIWKPLRSTFSPLSSTELSWQVAARFVVPGWPQIFIGQLGRGVVFLGLYLALLLLGLLYWGTSWGSSLLGFALSVHISSIVDIAFSGEGEGDRIVSLLRGLLYASLAGVVVYGPVMWVTSRFVVPLQIIQATEPFQANDVIVYNPSAYRSSAPEPGDVIVYNMVQARVSSLGGGVIRRGVNVVLSGRQIDRVLAGPGQHVKVVDGQMQIDGEPAAFTPLNDSLQLGDGELTVPEGCYLIVPSTVPYFDRSIPLPVWERQCIAAADIAGKAYFRKYPIRRIGRIR